MLGAIVGDIVGSRFEFDRGPKSEAFELFGPGCDYTDDTVMTLAIADAVLTLDGAEADSDHVFTDAMQRFGAAYPHPSGGYGGRFAGWLVTPNPHPYGSFGNGSAMRVSPIGWISDDRETVARWAERSARVTHNHPEGIKGAQAVGIAIWAARQFGGGVSAKADLRDYLTERFGYDLSRTLDEIRPTYHHDESCQRTVPEAIIAYLESHDFEDAIRKAVSLGGDSDTLTAITGSIAEAAYGIPVEIAASARSYLDAPLCDVLDRFEAYRAGGGRPQRR